MKHFAVIDTNVIVSAMLKRDSYPAQVLKEVLIGNINLLINESILNEYLEVLSRKKFGLAVACPSPSFIDQASSNLQSFQ